MALNAALEALCVELDKVDPALGKAQREILEKNEKAQKLVEEGVLRQSDYSKFMNDNKAKIEYGDSMRKWYDDNKPKYDAALTERDRISAENADLKKKVTESAEAVARAAAGAGRETVDPAVVSQAVMDKIRASGEVPTKTELAGMVEAETKKQADAVTKL